MGAPGRKDDHDFMTDEEIAKFLRGTATGPLNYGRQFLVSEIRKRNYKAIPKVLDAACGTAINWETFKLANYYVKYTGMDRTAKMLDHAKSLYGDEINLVDGYVQEFPCENNSFDVVIFRHIFEHLPPGDMEKALAEAYRVSNDIILVSFFLRPSDDEDHVFSESPSNDGRDGCTHFWNTYSHSKLCELFKGLGHVRVSSTYKEIVTPGAAHGDTVYMIEKL